jgi:hypothetical protein
MKSFITGTRISQITTDIPQSKSFPVSVCGSLERMRPAPFSTVSLQPPPVTRSDVSGVFAAYIIHRPDDGGSKYVRNVDKLVPDYTALQPRRQPSLQSRTDETAQWRAGDMEWTCSTHGTGRKVPDLTFFMYKSASKYNQVLCCTTSA